MDPSYNLRGEDRPEPLEDTDSLEDASLDQIKSVFSFLGIEEYSEEVLEDEIELEMWAQTDPIKPSVYATKVMYNEPVEGVIELTVKSGDYEETYLGRVELGSQDIFSLTNMAKYGEDSNSVVIEESYEENEEIEAD